MVGSFGGNFQVSSSGRKFCSHLMAMLLICRVLFPLSCEHFLQAFIWRTSWANTAGLGGWLVMCVDGELRLQVVDE
jgi:hypothetical protein